MSPGPRDIPSSPAAGAGSRCWWGTLENVLTMEHPDLCSPMERDGEKPERNQEILPSTWWMRPRMMGRSWAPQSSPRVQFRRRESNPAWNKRHWHKSQSGIFRGPEDAAALG